MISYRGQDHFAFLALGEGSVLATIVSIYLLLYVNVFHEMIKNNGWNIS